MKTRELAKLCEQEIIDRTNAEYDARVQPWMREWQLPNWDEIYKREIKRYHEVEGRKLDRNIKTWTSMWLNWVCGECGRLHVHQFVDFDGTVNHVCHRCGVVGGRLVARTD